MEQKANLVHRDGVVIEFYNNTIKIAGHINHLNPSEFMKPFLKEVHKNVIENGLNEVKIDIRELKHLNPAGIKMLLFWIMALDQDNFVKKHKYSIKFICNSNLEWQRFSIESLASLNPNIVNFEVK